MVFMDSQKINSHGSKNFKQIFATVQIDSSIGKFVTMLAGFKVPTQRFDLLETVINFEDIFENYI